MKKVLMVIGEELGKVQAEFDKDPGNQFLNEQLSRLVALERDAEFIAGMPTGE